MADPLGDYLERLKDLPSVEFELNFQPYVDREVVIQSEGWRVRFLGRHRLKEDGSIEIRPLTAPTMERI